MISRTLTYLAFSLLLSFLHIDSSCARSKLPNCPSVSAERYDNCFGTHVEGNGNKFVGEFKNGKYNGYGTYTIAVGQWKGDIYIGEFKDGKASGQGTYFYSSGHTYSGEFRDWKMNGSGTFILKNGEKYVGEFQDGNRIGQGTLTFGEGKRKGDQYVGEFKGNNISGRGTYTFANRDMYVGQFKDGRSNGQGTYTWGYGAKYVGEWKDGKQNGQGAFTYVSGEKWVGGWRDDKFTGGGVRYSASGTIIDQGIYENGNLTNRETVPSQASANTHRVQMVKQGGTYTVPVLINDVLMLHFIVDSGAADVTIPADVAMTLNRTGTIKPSDFIGSQKYQLADGSVIDSAQFIIRSLKVGDQIVENVRGSIGDAKGSLLLGQSFLEKFKSWSMDNASHELVLE